MMPAGEHQDHRASIDNDNAYRRGLRYISIAARCAAPLFPYYKHGLEKASSATRFHIIMLFMLARQCI